MKGKGKGPNSEKEKDRDIKDCPLQFLDLSTIDHTKECPKYTQVLEKGAKGHITLEELDQIQADIEILLASVGRRLKLLESENQILVSWPDKKDGKKNSQAKDSKSEAESQTSSPAKRKASPFEEKPSSKKAKDSNGRSVPQPSTPNSVSKNKGKNAQSKGQPDDGTVGDGSSDLPKLPKNDAVNRFWTSVEPYCTPITNDDLRTVEEMLKCYEEETDYMKIPPLGVHYTQRWSQEDLLEEKNDGAKIIDKKQTNGNATLNGTANGDTNGFIKKSDMKKNDYFVDDSPFGPLTQRLVSALIEDNLMTPMEDSIADTAETGEEVPTMSPRSLAKQLNLGNPATLERRIRKELEEQGILEKEEEEEDDVNDEVLAELRKKQQELRAISQQNINILKSLYRQGQEDIARQELRKKLVAADSDVMDAYRKIQSARQKKRSPNKKEKEAISKALKDREAIVKALEL